MYSTCIFCGGRLGTNEVIEEFPVGRRVAFDPAKGRLWALCGGCRQWNLAPLEERWEALEALERTWRATPTRYTTGEVGVARHREGLELVRVGRPTLPEYAAWRYGAELVGRRKKALAVTGASLVLGGLVVGGAQVGLLAGTAWGAVHLVSGAGTLYNSVVKSAAQVDLPDGRRVALKERHVRHASLEREGEVWRLSFPFALDLKGAVAGRWRKAGGSWRIQSDRSAVLEGEAAMRAAAKILPALNLWGASSRRLEEACRFVEETGSAEAAFLQAARTHPAASAMLTAPPRSPHRALHRLPGTVRLGLEIAAQEGSERRALEGELALLEKEWREAEEIAAIADDLLLPERIRRFFGR